MAKIARYKRIYLEYKNATRQEIWEGVRDNFIWGFLGSTLIVFVSTKMDKLIVFPIPTALGAFVGYKLSYLLAQLF